MYKTSLHDLHTVFSHIGTAYNTVILITEIMQNITHVLAKFTSDTFTKWL